MDRFSYYKDLSDADKWLTKFLLGRQTPASKKLLTATKLTDLIYESMSFGDVYYGTKRPEYPVNAENLASDLFTALFSPVIRKKDTNYVKLRERHFNKPILDSVLTDDRFDTLKKLCEDRELTSYEAASTFAKKLSALLERKPFQTKVRYIFIIEQLNKQISKIVEKIQQSKNNPKTNTAEKLLPLYECIRQKLTQIANLEAKLMEEALCYVQGIVSDINDAFDQAVERTVEVNCIMTAWGTDSGEMKNTPANKELLEHVKKSEELLRIARSLGKYREFIIDKRKNGFAYGRGEKYDLTLGNDINSCLSSELALLGTHETEMLFMRKYEQKCLAQYRKRTEIIKGKGDMIVLVDESWSTREVQAWAKAFALAMLDIAAKDNRKFAMVHFASADNVKTDLFEPGHYTSNDIIRAAEQFFGGGTDFEAPLTEAINLMEKGYENADITIITDGECRISDEFAEKFRHTMAKYKASVTGILLDKDRPCGKTLEPFCDKIYHSKEITEDEIAKQILKQKAS
jgi:uncharacterized protein with von Willebrand factor type A (vWA) domain